MDISTARKAAYLLEDIEYLSRYKGFMSSEKHGKTAHFELCQGYGEGSPTLVFNHKYTHKFLPVVEGILKELNDELNSL